MKTPDGTAPLSFDLLAFIESTRSGEPVCAREHGISRLIGEQSPVSAGRAGLPLPTLEMLRDLQLSTASGANLAGLKHNPLEQLAGAARPLLVLDRAGIPAVTIGDAQASNLPRWRGTAGGWVTEGQALTPPALELSTVATSAHQCGAFVSFSRRLRLSTSSDLQAAVVTELERQVRGALEAGLITGDGLAGRPLGLLAQAGSGLSIASPAPTWAEVRQMLQVLTAADGDLANAVWLAHPTTAVAMLATERVTGSGVSIVDVGPGGTWTIAGLPLVTSTAIPASKVVVLDRRAATVVYFGPPQLLVNPFSGSNSVTGLTTVILNNYADIGVSEPSLVVVGSA